MKSDHRNLLDVLKKELEFVEKGGYRHPARAAWRPQFMFQDSPTCPNFESSDHQQPCSDCIISQLVPVEASLQKIPCRYIPLNEQGDTLDLLYRTATDKETEAKFVAWLKTTVARLEGEKAQSLRTSDQPVIHVHGHFVSLNPETCRREGSMFSVCANPDCHRPFDCEQGRLFRFHKNYPVGGSPPNIHSVQHFWLCSSCLRTFTLEYNSDRGVLIKPLAVRSADPNAFRFIAAA